MKTKAKKITNKNTKTNNKKAAKTKVKRG